MENKTGLGSNKKVLLEFIAVAVLSFGIVFGFLGITGTLTCGWHMVDDHEFAEFYYMLNKQHMSLKELILSWLQNDLQLRYRPLYYPIRILEVYFFGINLFAISVIRAVIIAFTLIALYYCGRQMGAKKDVAFLFSMLCMIGYQGAAWWKLGPQESFGTFLMALGFYFMAGWIKNKKIKYAIFSLILFVLMGNYKESYIVVLPFMAAYVVYDVLRECSTIREMWKKRQKLEPYFWYISSILIIMCLLIWRLILHLGFQGSSASGGGIFSRFGSLFGTIVSELSGDLKWYRYGTLLLLAILLTYWDELKKLWKEMVLTILFIAPQQALYAQSGLTERYILPASVGYSFFFAIVILMWPVLRGKRKKAYVLVLTVMLIMNIRGMYIEADYFRYRGNSVTTMLKETYMLAGEKHKILSCFSPTEESNLTLKYWMLDHDYNNVYYYHEENHVIDKEFRYDSYPDQTGSSPEQVQPDAFDIVVMYNRDDRHFDHEPSLDLTDFTLVKCGTLTIAIRNNSGVEIPAIEIKPAYYYRQG